MASGARDQLGTDLAIATSGIAGPGGGTDTKPVGLVHYAVATAAGTQAESAVFRGDRERIRLAAAYAALNCARRTLLRPITNSDT